MSFLEELRNRLPYSQEIQKLTPEGDMSIDNVYNIILKADRKKFPKNDEEHSERIASNATSGFLHAFEKSGYEDIFLETRKFPVRRGEDWRITFFTYSAIRTIVKSPNIDSFYRSLNLTPSDIKDVRIKTTVFKSLKAALTPLIE